MLRIKFKKPCHVSGKTYAAGDEIDIDDAFAERIVAIGAAEILGPSDHYEPQPVNIESGPNQPSFLGSLKKLFTR